MEKYKELKNPIQIGCNTFIPKYLPLDNRARDRNAIEYYPTGELQSIYLESIQMIQIECNNLNAEYVTFYKQGQIHRIFPVYGKLSGFWSEEEEKQLLKANTVFIGGKFYTGLFSCICFYPSGVVKSLTIWPGESISILYNRKKVTVRNGISFYEDGTIKAFEPKEPLMIQHRSGSYVAFDPLAMGISGDYTSLCFYPNGDVKSLKTVLTGIYYLKTDKKEKDKNQEKLLRLQPELVVSLYDITEKIIMPMTIEFTKKHLYITDSSKRRYKLLLEQVKETYQVVENIPFMTCGDCATCNRCIKEK